MRVIKDCLKSLPSLDEPLAFSMGNFDGVHLGHRHLINQLVGVAREKNMAAAVMTFDPHPDVVLGQRPFQPILSLESRIEKLKDLGVDILLIQNFSLEFSKVSAQDFLRQYLVKFKNLRYLLLGYDFKFGQKGEGDWQYAKDYYSPFSVPVDRWDAFKIDEEVVSSSLIRAKLKEGAVDVAARLLGGPYSLSGEVCEGQALGRTLGFPTANLGQLSSMIPGHGVYCTHFYVDGQKLTSVTNVGKRPTVSTAQEVTVESHIFDFDADIYQRPVKCEFVHKIRDEIKFASIDELKKQIEWDKIAALEFFGQKREG